MNALHRIIGFSVIVVVCFGTAKLGGSLDVFLDIPSLIFVAGLTIGGLLVAAGPHAAVGAFYAAFMGHEREPCRLAGHINVLSLAHQMAWGIGIVGMFIGLIAMLSNMSDPATIGGAMGVGMLPLLYAAAWAELIVNPLRHGLIAQLINADTETQPTGAGQTPSTGRFAAFACVSWVLTMFFVTILAFSDLRKDAEYQQVTDSIREAFGPQSGAPQTSRVIKIEWPE